MIKLNLVTNNEAEKLIKEYLENNVSEELANKINNGITISKDDKTLINRKDLNSFMHYANEQARKLAETGATYTCVEYSTVFNWAIHYFEEDSIEGKLFNEDGTEYIPITKTRKPSASVKVATKAKEENRQTTLFDLMNLTQETKQLQQEEIQSITIKTELEEPPIEYDYIEDNSDDFTEEEFDEALDSVGKEIQIVNNIKVNTTTGEVLEKSTPKTFDKETMKILYTILDGKLEVK